MMHNIFAVIILAAGGYYALCSDGVIPDRWNYIANAKPKILPMSSGMILGIVMAILIWIVS